MNESPLDLQSELFDEFNEQNKQKTNPENAEDNSVFNISWVKNTKIYVPLDTLILLLIMVIFVFMTFYFLGVKRGISLQKKTVVTVEKIAQIKKTSGVVSKVERNKASKNVRKASSINPKKNVKKLSSKPLRKESLPQTFTKKKTIVEKKVKPKKYTIQVGASRDGSAAKKDILKLKKKGYNAFLSTYVSSNGKKWFKICVGTFYKTAEAKSLLKKLKSVEKKQDCFLTNL
ncbi:hypothetical protein AB834_05295 [PVC group bacterium (ex Bugula neritina AB1)]|nr:hypothetical protein AB834_05295 [PVC group bacterium (ex Bugula neritina AB1)]